MYFRQKSHSPYFSTQLLSPSFAYMLANPEERMRCSSPATRQAAKAEAFSSSFTHVVDETDRFLLFTDLPGVKVDDVKVEVTDRSALHIRAERKKGEDTLTFDRHFMVDDQLVDVSKITASLSDGTLQIIAPKKEETKPRKVAVVGESPSALADKELSFEVEVPGVKVQAIQVGVEGNGKLVISGERKRGGSTETIYRAFSLNKRVVDTDKLEVFLEDGVLTIRAPKNEPLAGRVIPVSTSVDDEQDEVDEAKESDDKKEDEVVQEEGPTADKAEATLEDKPTSSDPSTTEEENSSDKSTETAGESDYEVIPETVVEENE